MILPGHEISDARKELNWCFLKRGIRKRGGLSEFARYAGNGNARTRISDEVRQTFTVLSGKTVAQDDEVEITIPKKMECFLGGHGRDNNIACSCQPDCEYPIAPGQSRSKERGFATSLSPFVSAKSRAFWF